MSKRKLPSELCVGCNRTIKEIGGRRIIWSRRGGITTLGDESTFSFNKIESTKSYIYNVPFDERIIFMWGNYVQYLNNDSFNYIYDELRNKKRLWICQECAEWALCRFCGFPLKDAPASEVLNDNGCIRHVAILGVDIPCTRCNKGD